MVKISCVPTWVDFRIGRVLSVVLVSCLQRVMLILADDARIEIKRFTIGIVMLF